MRQQMKCKRNVNGTTEPDEPRAKPWLCLRIAMTNSSRLTDSMKVLSSAYLVAGKFSLTCVTKYSNVETRTTGCFDVFEFLSLCVLLYHPCTSWPRRRKLQLRALLSRNPFYKSPVSTSSHVFFAISLDDCFLSLRHARIIKIVLFCVTQTRQDTRSLLPQVHLLSRFFDLCQGVIKE